MYFDKAPARPDEGFIDSLREQPAEKNEEYQRL